MGSPRLYRWVALVMLVLLAGCRPGETQVPVWLVSPGAPTVTHQEVKPLTTAVPQMPIPGFSQQTPLSTTPAPRGASVPNYPQESSHTEPAHSPANAEVQLVQTESTPEQMAPSEPQPGEQAGKPAHVAVEWVDVWDLPENEHKYWHRQTQLIMAEPVLVFAEQGDWAQIIAVQQPSSLDPRGYPGWVRRNTLLPGWIQADHWIVVMRKAAFLRTEPDLQAEFVQRLHLDMRLPVRQVEGSWVLASLPDGRSGWVTSGDVRITSDLAQPQPFESFWFLVEEHQGVPYFWGGTTGYGLDCSGLIYRLFHAHGVILPRDARDQSDRLDPVPPGQPWQAGDLFFYRRGADGLVVHVGIYAGSGQVWEASPELGVSLRRADEMRQQYPWFEARRFKTLP